LLGTESIIGLSTHSVDEAIQAVKEPVNYIAIGPIFSTSTKANHAPIVGIEGLINTRKAVGNFPLVAIGGIGMDNIADVIAAGADSAAVISAAFSLDDGIECSIASLLERSGKFR
jgi:thiamine-phosphate pyrophosphorylase